MIKRITAVLVLFLGLAIASFGQTSPPVQHFVMSTTAGSFGGSAVAIASSGVQLTVGVSTVYEFISNPSDSSKPRIGSGVVNYTFAASSIVPKSLKSKLLIDLSNYNVTLQGGAGSESVSQGAGLPRARYTVGNAGIFGNRPMPGGHTQFGLGYKWIFGKHGGLVKVPAGTLNFTF